MVDTSENEIELLRNHRGEWISIDNAIILNENDVASLLDLAKRCDFPFFIEYDRDNIPWVCKREYEDLMRMNSNGV